MITANQLRQTWLDFFAEHGHSIVPSMGLIPHHPTAPMFTNAGMNQFVSYFLEEEAAPYDRATSVQKCVRLSGKHNDIDELGKTRRHLSFFEMLGNFSFGDYFKEGAIKLAWDLCTERVGFDGDRLWITIHDTDDEAEAIWHEVIGLPMERIQRLGKDNFWEMGESGPCGPCSEVHLDCGPEWGDAGGPAHGGGDRYIEFWNLVFMQNFRNRDGSLSDLPKKNIDTGGGLERWLMLLQNVPTVFDTDAIRPMIETAESISGKKYGGDARDDTYMRIIGDHARTMAFLINDGVTPSNEGRGYLLRSVIRRAVRRGYQLGIDKPFLIPVLDRTLEVMGEAYPELRANREGIASTLDHEEGRFRRTLAQGSELLEDELSKGQVSGAIAFRLHDTFGFPIELTQEMAEERGVAVDREGFEAAMAQQREQSKSAQKSVDIEAGSTDAYRRILDESGPDEFTGYQQYETPATVVAVLRVDEKRAEIFLNRTPFYAEAGGQVGDTGFISTDTGTARVLDTTFALPGLHRHLVEMVDGNIDVGQEARTSLDAVRRDAIRRNHTGTHLLHWALRETLGAHVKQAGSLVADERLRFDFSHFGPVTRDEMAQVEHLANVEVLSNEPVRAYETTRQEAEAMGAIAFFGEKYGDVVRVVEGGHTRELCGGTHVHALGSVGAITVIAETSIGSNLRRLEALTGDATVQRLQNEREVLFKTAELLRTSPDDVTNAVERLLQQKRDLDAEIASIRNQAAVDAAKQLAASARNGVVVERLDGLDADQLRQAAVAARDNAGMRAVALIGSPDGRRVGLVVATEKGGSFDAGELVAGAARIVGGGGGRGQDLAVAGGKDVSRIDEALEQLRGQLGG